MTRLLASSLIFALALLPACKASGNEAYAEALTLLGEAERGPCKSTFDGSGQQIVGVAQIGDCLIVTEQALTKLREAKQLGADHQELEDLLIKTEEEVRRLESMKRMVLRMSNNLDVGPSDAAKAAAPAKSSDAAEPAK